MAANPDIEPTLETVFQRERERFTRLRNEAIERRKQLDEEIAAYERELYALDVYEQAKKGKIPTQERTEPREPRATGRRGRRDDLLKHIQEHFEAGCTRADLLRSMNIDEKDEEGKRAAQSVSNALSALVKSGKLVREGREYKLP